jgi:carbamoyl-phosphate synthase large subunit
MSETGCNILITSAGRRVQLVRFFQRALADLGLPGKVLAVDANPVWSAAAREADGSSPAPLLGDLGYVPFLLEFVRGQNARFLVPTIDTELTVLAGNRDLFAEAGCEAVVSDLTLIEVCRDKRKSFEWFRGLGFETPRIFDRSALEFPCFAKPFDGSMSKGAISLPSAEHVAPTVFRDERLIFMEYFDPAEYDEYTVDTYYDRTGSLKCLVPRKRVEVRGGEISKGVALKGTLYTELCSRLARIEGARGCLTYQFFVAKNGGRVVASELNARFGGGYPLSQAAGARFPEWLIREYVLGENVPFFDDWQDRTAMARYDSEVIFLLPDESLR